MRYLKSHAKGKIIYNVREPDYLNIRFADHNWDDLYPGAMEEIAPKWPNRKEKRSPYQSSWMRIMHKMS